MIQELQRLQTKILASEDFVARVEEYFSQNKHRWSDEVIMGFEIYLERKRDQIYYEHSLAEKLAWKIALHPYVSELDL